MKSKIRQEEALKDLLKGLKEEEGELEKQKELIDQRLDEIEYKKSCLLREFK